MNNITLGRYVPFNTYIHKLDARTKLMSLILLTIAVFFSYSTYAMTFIIGGILAVLILSLLLISKVSLISVFKSLKVLWMFVIIIMLINTLVPPANAVNVAFSIGKLKVYYEAIFQSLKIILRLILMIELTMVLTATTKPLELTYALEWFLHPLKVVRFPVHEVAMTISIALRFIPTLLDETQRIMKAQSSRGVDFNHGKISSRLKAIVSLIIPLFISSFQRSEELADSMEARGYDPRATRTRYRVLKFAVSDLFVFIFSVLVLSAVIVANATKFAISTPYFAIILPSVVGGVVIYMIMLLIIYKVRGNRV